MDIETHPSGPRYIDTRPMSVEEWYTIQKNPIQRRTEKRAPRAANNHLKSTVSAHCRVIMAILPDGSRYKVDGHTRAYLWQLGKLDPPDQLFVDVFLCKNEDEVEEVYTWFDNRSAAETAYDRTSGAVDKLGVTFNSPHLQQLKFINALKISHRNVFNIKDWKVELSTEMLLSYWLPELYLLDDIHPTSNTFRSPVIVGALCTFRRYGPSIHDFWKGYQKDAGHKMSGEWDGIYAFSSIAKEMISNKSMNATQESSAKLLGLAVSTVRSWIEGRLYTGGAKRTQGASLRDFLDGARKTVRTW